MASAQIGGVNIAIFDLGRHEVERHTIRPSCRRAASATLRS
jgi:hypothetical protein